jgi:hypothetical protein
VRWSQTLIDIAQTIANTRNQNSWMSEDSNKVSKIPGTLFRSLVPISQRELTVIMYMPIVEHVNVDGSGNHIVAINQSKRLPSVCAPETPLQVMFVSSACPQHPQVIELTPEQQIARVKTPLISVKEGEARNAVARQLCKRRICLLSAFR